MPYFSNLAKNQYYYSLRDEFARYMIKYAFHVPKIKLDYACSLYMNLSP